MKQKNIRNFSIIAHIDHGKSTLADRLIELTGALDQRQMKDQILDSMDIERERGITIKLNTVTLNYNYQGEDYQLNLIDTPGHVDFSYEVSRSLASCEGALLVVDAHEGIEAQTLANLYLALDHNLAIIPVINKIDLPNAEIEKVEGELESLGFDKKDILKISAKTGQGVPLLLEQIVTKLPCPKGEETKPLRALIFDSIYDSYRGVLMAVRVFDGELKVGDMISMLQTDSSYEVLSLFINTPKEKEKQVLKTGEVGYVYASIKSINDIHVGDTLTTTKTKNEIEPLPGYQPMKSMVYCGLYPIETSEFEFLRSALAKLKLNDAALTFEPETSLALGFGFRCGFLGLLHMDVTKERLEREFSISLIATAPSVKYQVLCQDATNLTVESPFQMPDKSKIKEIKEPYVKAHIYTPKDYIGPIIELSNEKRGIMETIDYITDQRVVIIYDFPLSEIIYDFFDRLKSITKGYASFDYEFIGDRVSDLVKLDVLLNGETVDALSMIVHRSFADKKGRELVERLKEVIPRQLFEVPVQASVGGKIIARTDIKALRKNVLAKCYGGDITRKKKLLEKQKEGKKKMKRLGSVEVPQEAFLALLTKDKN
ncbi:MAG: translation elongation factor 4 [bacterium]|nr:translation elongation factor 4 [bacterium]